MTCPRVWSGRRAGLRRERERERWPGRIALDVLWSPDHRATVRHSAPNHRQGTGPLGPYDDVAR